MGTHLPVKLLLHILLTDCEDLYSSQLHLTVPMLHEVSDPLPALLDGRLQRIYEVFVHLALPGPIETLLLSHDCPDGNKGEEVAEGICRLLLGTQPSEGISRNFYPVLTLLLLNKTSRGFDVR